MTQTSPHIIKFHFKSADPVLYPVIKTINFSDWIKPEKDPTQYFARLCREIIAQQLSIHSASAITKRFSQLFPQSISPELLITIPDQKLRDVGLSWAKAGYVKDLAKKTLNKQIPYTKFSSLNDLQIKASLIKVKGIGAWTADMFLIFAMGRENIFSYGDVGLKRAMKKLYQLESSPTPKKAGQIVGRWSPYKSYGCCALWHSLSVKVADYEYES